MWSSGISVRNVVPSLSEFRGSRVGGIGVENINWEGEAIVIIQMQFALVVCRNEKLLSKW